MFADLGGLSVEGTDHTLELLDDLLEYIGPLLKGSQVNEHDVAVLELPGHLFEV